MPQTKTYSRKQLAERASLTEEDFFQVNQCRREHNRLGFAYQVCFVRLMNRFPIVEPLEVIDELLVYAGVQLQLDPESIEPYRRRQQTISDHQIRIRDYLGLQKLEGKAIDRLEAFLFDECFRIERTASLVAKAHAFLAEQGVLTPAESKILRIIGEQRAKARKRIEERITQQLPTSAEEVFGELLTVDDATRVSKLQNIKSNPDKSSPEAILTLLEKMTSIESAGVLSVDLSWLNSNYQRALFHYVRNCSVDRLRDLSRSRRDAAMTCFLWQTYRDAVDQAMSMFHKLLNRIETLAQNELDERMREKRQGIQQSLQVLKTLASAILDSSIPDDALRDAVYGKIPKEHLEAKLEEITEWTDGISSHRVHGIVKRFAYLRKFSPQFFRSLEFQAESSTDAAPALEALSILQQLNEENKRKLPEEAPIEFVPARFRRVVDASEPERRPWECSLLYAIRDEVQAGNLSLKYSKRYGKFDDFFIPRTEWEELRPDFFQRSGLPSEPSEVGGYLVHRLDVAYDRFLETAPSNSYAQADESGWKLSVDKNQQPDSENQLRIDKFKAWLGHNMRKIRLPELLIEVDNAIGFTKHFMTPAQQQNRTAEDVCTALAAVMAHGCNIGPYTMAQLTPGISYKQIKRVSDWQLTEDAQRNALAELVAAIAGLDTTLTWGQGKTSASDGQRFLFPRKVLQQTYSPRFSDFALEFYSFVSDNYAPFYSTPIECTDRDAAHVLDGLLYNESDLELEEHYTDTHGYTEINFAAFAMLGRRFCPRIRGVQHQQIYRMDTERDYGALENLVSRANRTIKPDVIAAQWDRLGHFYASLERGHTTASVALRRLVRYSAKNRFFRANRDLGRVFKTEFILQYLSQPQLRSRIRRGLLKVEELHALARDVFYGKRGRVNAREIQEQLNSCSCLTLILSCIIYWQANEISDCLSNRKPEELGLDLDCLQHVSPIEWDNVVLYGEYRLDRKLIRSA